jgi:hypothetical protein
MPSSSSRISGCWTAVGPARTDRRKHASISSNVSNVARARPYNPVALLAPRGSGGPPRPPHLELTDASAPGGLDLLFARDKHAIEPLLRAYEPDLMLCWGFPWKIPQAALEVPRLGSVNMLIATALTLLPRALEWVAAGDPGDPQPPGGASWAGHFEDDDYARIDWAQSARAIHNQVRAWHLTFGMSGLRAPIAELDGEEVVVLQTRLTDPAGGARRVECGDRPIWVVATEPV